MKKFLNKDNIINIYILILFIIIPVIPLKYNSRLTIQLILTGISTILVIITLFFTKNINLKNKVKIEKIEYLLLIYIILIFISSLLSKFTKYAFLGTAGRSEGFYTLLLYITVFYIMWKDFKFSNKMFQFVTLAVVIVATYGIFGVIYKHEYAAVSTMGNPNFLSTYLTMFLPILMLVYLKSGKIMYLEASGIVFVCLLLSKTSSGYVTFIIYSIIIIIYTILRKLGIKKLLILITCFITLFIGTNIYTNGDILNEIINVSNDVKNIQQKPEEIGSGRGRIYMVTLKTLLNNPIWGVGPDCLGLYLYLTNDAIIGKVVIDKAHCEYLQIAVTTGIPSLIIYMIFILIIAKKIISKYKQNKDNIIIFAIGLSILSYLIQAVFNIIVTHIAPIFWAMLGIGLNLAEKGEESEEK